MRSGFAAGTGLTLRADVAGGASCENSIVAKTTPMLVSANKSHFFIVVFSSNKFLNRLYQAKTQTSACVSKNACQANKQYEFELVVLGAMTPALQEDKRRCYFYIKSFRLSTRSQSECVEQSLIGKAGELSDWTIEWH